MPAPFCLRSLDSAERGHPTEAVSNNSLEIQARAAEQAVAAGTADAFDCMVAALGRSERDDLAGAETLLQRALTMEPSNPAVLTGLAVVRRKQGRLREAVLACDAAIRFMPGYADAWLERGLTLAAGGSSQPARESFIRAVQLAPQMAKAHAALAATAARDGDFGAARDFAAEAIKRDPQNAVAICAMANADIAEGHSDAAREALLGLLKDLDRPSSDRSFALGLLANAYDKLGEYEPAFEAYAASKADFAAINAAQAEGRLTHREFVEAIHGGLVRFPAAEWAAPSLKQPDSAARRHVFLLGYPRSGTTLLENVLASLPGAAALEERPTFAVADRDYLMGDRAEVVEGLARFSQLDAVSIELLRQAYWTGVHSSGVAEGVDCFVDMDPLKGTRLPFIARMFPEARILIMRRDPRDVVWSCFRTNFAMTSGTLEYSSLERTARHYDAMMRLTESAIARLDLRFHEVHYHRLVQDFDRTTRDVCDFLELEWSEALRQFDRTAQARGVSTASAAQVTRGLYDGTRQWEPYARFLEPIMPLLQPWIDRLGYA